MAAITAMNGPDGSLEPNLPSVQQRDMVGEAADLIEALRRPEDGSPVVDVVADQSADPGCTLRIQIVRRLVDEQDRRRHQESPSDRQTLLHAVRIPPNPQIARVVETDSREALARAYLRLASCAGRTSERRTRGSRSRRSEGRRTGPRTASSGSASDTCVTCPGSMDRPRSPRSPHRDRPGRRGCGGASSSPLRSVRGARARCRVAARTRRPGEPASGRIAERHLERRPRPRARRRRQVTYVLESSAISRRVPPDGFFIPARGMRGPRPDPSPRCDPRGRSPRRPDASPRACNRPHPPARRNRRATHGARRSRSVP